MSKVVVIIPAYNEKRNIGEVIEEIKGAGIACDIVVIDDGSRDETTKISRQHGVEVLELSFNMGIGCALQTGYKYAYAQGYDFAVLKSLLSV